MVPCSSTVLEMKKSIHGFYNYLVCSVVCPSKTVSLRVKCACVLGFFVQGLDLLLERLSEVSSLPATLVLALERGVSVHHESTLRSHNPLGLDIIACSEILHFL